MSYHRDDHGGGRHVADNKRDRDDYSRDSRDHRDGRDNRDRDRDRDRDRNSYNRDNRDNRDSGRGGRGGGRGGWDGNRGRDREDNNGAYNPNFPTRENQQHSERGGRGGFSNRGSGFSDRPNNFNNNFNNNNPRFNNNNFNNNNFQNRNQDNDRAQKFRKFDPVPQDIVAPPVPAGEPEGYRLFVVCSRQLPEDVISEQFEVFGEMLSCTLLKDKDGNSRGCAFITYAKKSAAAYAIEQMDGTKFYGQEMKVQFQVENQKGGVGYKTIDRETDLSVEEQLDMTGRQEVEEDVPLTPEEEAIRQARVNQAVKSGIEEAAKTQKEIDDRLEQSVKGRQYNEDEYDY